MTASPTLSRVDLGALTAAVAETAERYDRSADFPTDGLAAVHRAGVFQAVLGERFGGDQVDALERLRILQAIGRGDPSVALIVANTLATHIAQIDRDVWPAHLYERVVAETAEQLVAERLALGNGVETAVLHLLGVELERVVGELESLLHERSELADAATLVTKNLLGVGGADDDLGAGVCSANAEVEELAG